MVIKIPEKIFFTLYSNKTMKESEEIAKKYLNYKMQIFPDNQIDLEDKKKLEQNIIDIKSKEIFDDKLYNHGFYYNSYQKSNHLSICYYIGRVDANYNFIVSYIKYLFMNPQSLMKVLRDRNYILIENNIDVTVTDDIVLENNIYFKFILSLTDNGINNINDILIIINKYIDTIKEEGYQQKYFNNFVKYINNKIILNFNKQSLIQGKSFMKISLSHQRNYKPEEILLYEK